MDDEQLRIEAIREMGLHQISPKVKGLARLTVPTDITVRLPTDLTSPTGEALTPAEYRRKSKALRKAKRGGEKPI